MDTENTSYTGLVHAGGGAGLAIVQLGAIIPGFLAALAVAGLLLALVLVPMFLLALALGVVLAPPVGLWWAISRRRRDRRRPTPPLPDPEVLRHGDRHP
jgi:hypothetical protein